jgi:integrase
MHLLEHNPKPKPRIPWNKVKLTGQKQPLKLKEIWAIRIRLQLANRIRDLVFNLAVDGKLRACDLVRLRLQDVSHGGRVSQRAIVMQQKTQRPVQFEITGQTCDAIEGWINYAGIHSGNYLFKSQFITPNISPQDSMPEP